MAESQSMTTAEVVAKTLMDEHADFLREAVALVARELMESEISSEIGALRGEVSPERMTHRNGYRPRVGFKNSVPLHAAHPYSWMSPPSRSRRRTAV